MKKLWPVILIIFTPASSFSQNISVVTESYPPIIIVTDKKVSGIITEKVTQILTDSMLSYSIHTLGLEVIK